MSAAEDPKREGEDDGELLRRLTTDPAALEVFYRRHVAGVAAFVARRVRDADAVADIVSNTFLAAIGVGRLRPRAQPRLGPVLAARDRPAGDREPPRLGRPAGRTGPTRARPTPALR